MGTWKFRATNSVTHGADLKILPRIMEAVRRVTAAMDTGVNEEIFFGLYGIRPFFACLGTRSNARLYLD